MNQIQLLDIVCHASLIESNAFLAGNAYLCTDTPSLRPTSCSPHSCSHYAIFPALIHAAFVCLATDFCVGIPATLTYIDTAQTISGSPQLIPYPGKYAHHYSFTFKRCRTRVTTRSPFGAKNARARAPFATQTHARFFTI